MFWRRTLKLGAGAVLAAMLAAALFVALPLPDGFLNRRPAIALTFLDRTGQTLREVRSLEDGRSQPLPPDEIPPRVRDAFLATEDQRFDSHFGIDPLAIIRAATANLRTGRITSGASTITQQLARQLVPRRRTFVGKLGEALWAMRIAAHVPREVVLREYLNRVPLGNSLYGVEAASAFYFARPAARLSTSQAAMLAGMAAAPSRFDPFRHREASQARMRRVLGRMTALGMLDEESARRAGDSALDLVPAKRAFEAPHLVAWLARNLERLGLQEAIRVHTTLDPVLQSDVEEALREELAALKNRQVSQAAAIVLDNATGEVLAYAGSVDFLDDAAGGQNDGVRAARQPGSALKPFAFGLALASGRTPATLLADLETHFATPQGDYVPQNYDRRLHGPVRLRAALANSYNVTAVRLAEELGPSRVLEVMRRAGLDSLEETAEHYGVGLVLGNGEVTLRELARAFMGLANGGVVGPLSEVRFAEDANGTRLRPRPEMERRRFLPEDAVALLTDILSDENARAPAFGIGNALRLPFPVAAKTGTSRAHIDNWTVGYTRERTVGIWVGNFDGTPMRDVSGITGAGPIFRRVMIRAMKGINPAPLIDRSAFAQARICPLSGALAKHSCPASMNEIFLPRTAPTTSCPMHHGEGMHRQLDVGPEFYGWAEREGMDVTPALARGDSAQGVELVSPQNGAEFLLEPGRPMASQGIPIRVLVPYGIEAVTLRLDGEAIALGPPFSIRLEAVRGAHRLEVWLPGGTQAAAVSVFRVR